MISESTPMICTGTHVTYKRAKKIFSRCSCARRFEAYRYACAASCEYTVFLLVCTHVGDKHMWQAKQSCHWWDSLKVLVLPCPCLHQELLITCSPQHREWDTGRARNLRRQHEELSPANNFDTLPCCRFRNVTLRASKPKMCSATKSLVHRGAQ